MAKINRVLKVMKILSVLSWQIKYISAKEELCTFYFNNSSTSQMYKFSHLAEVSEPLHYNNLTVIPQIFYADVMPSGLVLVDFHVRIPVVKKRNKTCKIELKVPGDDYHMLNPNEECKNHHPKRIQLCLDQWSLRAGSPSYPSDAPTLYHLRYLEDKRMLKTGLYHLLFNSNGKSLNNHMTVSVYMNILYSYFQSPRSFLS